MRLFHCGSNVAYSSGHLLFVRQFTLMAQPFDPAGLRFTGEAVPIAEKVLYDGARSRAYFSASDEGRLVYLTGSGNEPEMAIFDSNGERLEVVGERGVNRMQFSPDGKKIVYDKLDYQAGRSDLWIYDLDRRITSRFTSNSGSNIVPQWSPSGDSIVFSSNRAGRFGIYMKSAAGTGEERLLIQGNIDYYVTSWSSDGRWLSVSTLGEPKTGNDLWMLSATGKPQLTPFSRSEFNEWVGKFSPDGRWIAFQSDETGKYEVYVRAADGSGGKWRISADGGGAPSWSHDGSRLYFTSPERKLLYASVRFSTTTPVVDTIATLFELEPRGIVGLNTQPTPDGRLFCGRLQDARVASAPIVLVEHWDLELSRQ
jgi:Tol biopolymer transport system component